jgi:nicotinate-nucleotide adenylyltransferase
MLRTSPDKGGRWGIMGGLFDPIHYGHLTLAEQAREAFSLNGILFVISFNPPHRREKPIASFDNRLQMVRLAVENNDSFAVTDIEKELDSPGYTLAMVELLKNRYPEVTWNLILGADNIESFELWHKPEDLIKKIKIVVGGRPGYKAVSNNSGWNEAVSHFEMPLMEVSSTLIRQRLKKGQSIRYFVPDKVRTFIVKKGLYR